MKEGTVGKWYKKEGDAVQKGEPIVEVVSEKATYDLESPASGVLRKIMIEAGVDVPVQTVLAIIADANEQLPEASIKPEAIPTTAADEGKRALASPAAKRLAREHGVDLSALKGSGPEGRIDEDDVKKLIETQSATLPRVKEIVALTGFRKTPQNGLQ